MDGHRTPQQTETTVALKTKCENGTAADIVTLLHGSSLASGCSEAEATSQRRGTSLAGNVVYSTFSCGRPILTAAKACVRDRSAASGHRSASLGYTYNPLF
jgi:hypothetical protein